MIILTSKIWDTNDFLWIEETEANKFKIIEEVPIEDEIDEIVTKEDLLESIRK